MPKYAYEIVSMDAVDLRTLNEDVNQRAQRGYRLMKVVETTAEPPEAMLDKGRQPVVLFIFEREVDDTDPAGG